MTSGNKAALCIALGFAIVPSAYGQAPGQMSLPARPLPSVTLNFGSMIGGLDDATATDTTITYGGELTVQADRLHGNLLQQNYLATGHVRIHDADTTLTAGTLQFQGQENQGTAENATLIRRPYTVRAAQIDITASTLDAKQGSFTTAPPGTRPDLEVGFSDLSLFPQRHTGVMRDASLYLLRARLITVRRIAFKFGSGSQGTRRLAVIPVIGASTRYGPYVHFGGVVSQPMTIHYSVLLPVRQTPQLQVTGEQSMLSPRVQSVPRTPSPVQKHDYLGAIRQIVAIPPTPLPETDPLLFHNYLPEQDTIRPLDGLPSAALRLNEEISTHIEASGRRQDNLYVYRLPEVRLSGIVPLAHVPTALPNDAAGFRRSMRHLALVASASADYGYFEEQPDHLHAARQQDSVGLTTRALLIAPDTLLQPRITYTANFYSGRHESYRYLQASVDVNHYFTPYSAIGVQYVGASTSGDSPFNFDVLDTPQQLTIRIQVGNRRLAVAGQVRFDLTDGGIYDYKLAFAPGLNGITPIVSYNFRSRSFGIGADIPGLTF